MVGSTLPTPRSTSAWFCTSCCCFDGCFRFLLCLPSVCSIASYIQYLIHWFLCRTPSTRIPHNLSKYGLFQSLSQYGLFQNPGLHTCFGLNLNRGLNNTNVFASKPSFTQRAVLHKNCVCFTQNNVLSGPVQGLFAAYRIALSMVAGGTRRRRLNMSIQIGKNALMLL